MSDEIEVKVIGSVQESVVEFESMEKINEPVDFTVSAESADHAEVIKSGDIRNVRLHFLLPKGDKGDRGEQGAKGDTGERGPKGETGAQGDRGPQGETGPIGRAFAYADFTPEQLAGLKGPKGDKGDQGQKGDTGAPFVYSMFTQQQLEALRGPQGEKGAKGDRGETGPQGAQGPKGDSVVGPEGPQGPKGEKGDPGTIDERTQAKIVQDVLGEIPDWAKAATKPSYTASEVGARASNWMPTAADVGALPDTTVIPDVVTDAHINALIDAKLGVIENGTY